LQISVNLLNINWTDIPLSNSLDCYVQPQICTDYMGKLADVILQLVITNAPEGKSIFYVSESNSTFQTLDKKIAYHMNLISNIMYLMQKQLGESMSCTELRSKHQLCKA